MVTPRAPRAARSGHISRPALLERLDDGAFAPVTVVAAPAGSGKTVLVRSWLEVRGSTQDAAWVSVERRELDAQHFWSTVVSELRKASPAGAIEPLIATPLFDGEAVVRRLVSDLASLERPIILVIDDVHEVAGRDILEQLTYFLAHLPTPIHVVLIGRRDPQLGLHRRQLEGGLTEIRSAHLSFTLDETREMMAGLGIDLSEASLDLLQDRTEGWVAGLRLAAISLAAHPDPERFIAEFSGSERNVAEYLLAEVLEAQPDDVGRLLVRTSLLAHVNGELGDLLTGNSGTERHLQALADSGGFVVALDGARTWFRVHHLFAEFLAARLRHTEPAEIPGLHVAAAKWHAEHGDVIEAIAHAQAGGDADLAVGLLIEHYFSLSLDGRGATAHALVEAFAADSVEARPELATVVANDQLAEGSLDQAAAHLALAERHAGVVSEDRRARFDMALLVTQLSYARRIGDFRSVADKVQAAGSLTEPHNSRGIARNNDVRALMLMNLGIAEVWSGHLEDGSRHLTAARELSRQIGRPYLEVSCHVHWAQAVSWRSFTRAGEASKEAIALAERHGWGADPVVGPALITLGTSLVQAGRLDESQRWLDRADGVLRSELEPAVGFVLHSVQGLVHFARGRYEETISSARKAERLAHVLITGSPLAVQLRSMTLHARLGMGELAAVRAELAQMPEAEREAGEVREVFAALALAEGDAETALEVLAPTLNGRADVHHPLVVLRSLLRAAQAHHALGDIPVSEDAVERALDLAARDALILPFMYTQSVGLLQQHPHHRTAHGAFLAEILDVVSGRSMDAVRSAPPALLEPLSDTELRVLRFLPTNLSAAGIAGEIYVSVNTVKTHMRHIYAKLDAHSRTEAVRRARELELLGHSPRRR
jgi:LuxR family maltose regulon positive regulatory protein